MNKGKERRGGGLASRVLVRTLASLLTVVVIALALRFGLPDLFGRLFSHRERITNVSVERRLEAIGELATYSMAYSGYTEAENARQVLGLNIPGTKNQVRIAYTGTIKVGYRVSDIGCAVDGEAGVIRLKLPEPIVISNEIDEGSLQYTQRNNIFNPIKGDAAAGYLEDIRKRELEKAVELGLYEKARENAEVLIGEQLAPFGDYALEFE